MNFLNNKLFGILTSLLLIIFAATSCKKFLDVNTDPNNLTSSKVPYIMTGALSNTVRIQITSNVHVVAGTWSGFYGHSTSYTGGGNEKTYVVTNTQFDWMTTIYDNIYDYQKVIERADAEGVGFWKDPAVIMQCYDYARLVDIYGDVPFTDAVHDLSNLTPKYDKQEDIYDSLIIRLDNAMASMQAASWPTASDVTRQDILFGLNKTDWIHFANTLKLRLLLHQDFMGTRDAYIVSNVQSTANLGYLDKNVVIQPGYAATSGKLNPYYSLYGFDESNTVTTNFRYRKMNKVIIDWLKITHDDYRLQGLAWPQGTIVTSPLPTWPSTASSYTYKGVPMGAGSGASNSTSSAMGPFYIQRGVTSSQTGPLVLFTLAESKFLQAEAAVKYPALATDLGDPATNYNDGVHAHFRLVGNMCYEVGAGNIINNAGNTQADAAYSAYIAQPIANVNWAASSDKLRAILIQKWVSFVHINGLEAWTDYRKSSVTSENGHTFYSVPLDPRSQVGIGNEPVRMIYPQIEFTTNGNNVPKGIDHIQDSPIFWDVNN